MTCDELVDRIALLLQRSTDASSVETLRIAPVKAPFDGVPLIFDAPEDDLKNASGANGPFTSDTTTKVTLRGYACAASDGPLGSDGGEVRVMDSLRGMRSQVLKALVNAPEVYALGVSQVSRVRSKIQLGDVDNGYQMAGLILELHFEHFQDWDEFAPLAADDADELEIDAQLAEPAGVRAQLTIPISE